MSAPISAKARKLLVEAMHGLRASAGGMEWREILDQPITRGNLRLADRIERYLEKHL